MTRSKHNATIIFMSHSMQKIYSIYSCSSDFSGQPFLGPIPSHALYNVHTLAWSCAYYTLARKAVKKGNFKLPYLHIALCKLISYFYVLIIVLKWFLIRVDAPKVPFDIELLQNSLKYCNSNVIHHSHSFRQWLGQRE